MKTYLQLDNLGEDIEAEVEYNYTPATPNVYYLSNGDPGYPGDPEEIRITRTIVNFDGRFVDIPVECLTESTYERICDEIYEYERN